VTGTGFAFMKNWNYRVACSVSRSGLIMGESPRPRKSSKKPISRLGRKGRGPLVLLRIVRQFSVFCHISIVLAAFLANSCFSRAGFHYLSLVKTQHFEIASLDSQFGFVLGRNEG
jgi:hypothetical protein